jgi:hypothetical protein
MKTKPTISLDQIEKTVRDAAESSSQIDDNISANELAEVLISEADREFLAELSHILVGDYYRKSVLAVRRKPRPTFGAQYALSQYEHLPQKAQVSDKERRPVVEMTYRQIRAVYWKLSAKIDERKKADPKLTEWKALLDQMEKRAKKEPGITVGRALGLT